MALGCNFLSLCIFLGCEFENLVARRDCYSCCPRLS